MIAEIVCGGDVEPGSVVDEQWLLDLERKAFIELAEQPEVAGTDHGHDADRQAGA